MEKEFPRHYQKSVVDILEAMSLDKGDSMRVIGSASVRNIQFAGDYDANETIHGSPAQIATKIQQVIKRLKKIPGIAIGDIKMGGTIENPIRWTPEDILKGAKDGTSLKDAVGSDAMRKIDVIGLVDGNRYTELSVVYQYPEEVLGGESFVNELKAEVKAKLKDKDYWKGLKRYYSIQRLLNHSKNIERMTPIFNGDLGRLYSVISDIEIIDYLLEHKQGDTAQIKEQIDGFKSRLANIWTLPEFLQAEPGFYRTMDNALRSISSTKKARRLLKRLSGRLRAILQSESLPLVKKFIPKNMR